LATPAKKVSVSLICLTKPVTVPEHHFSNSSLYPYYLFRAASNLLSSLIDFYLFVAVLSAPGLHLFSWAWEASSKAFNRWQQTILLCLLKLFYIVYNNAKNKEGN